MKSKRWLLLIITLSVSIQLAAQKRISKARLEMLQKSLKETPLLQDDDDFKSNASADAKWNDESAIILSQKTTFGFDKEGASAGKVVSRNLIGILLAPMTLGTSLAYANSGYKNQMLVQEKERRKILLQDNYAIDQYSVIYFRLSNTGDAFSARVIKKNGNIQDIDAAEAITVTEYGSIPNIYTSYTDPGFSRDYRPAYFKIPIADLEPGDMIEYEFIHFNTQTYYSNPDFKEFEPVYYMCSRDLPVARQAVEIITENDNYYITYKSLQGAPSFDVNTKDNKKIYRWTDNNPREKNKSTNYVNQYLEMPSVKFQVCYAKNKSKDYLWFEDEAAMHKDLTADQLAAQAKTLWFHPGKIASTGSYMEGLGGSDVDDHVKSYYKLLKKREIADAADEEYIQKAYYTIRSNTMKDDWSDYAFTKVLSGLLAQNKIDHEIVVAPYNTRTTVANLAFSNELAWMIKCNKKYYINPVTHLNPGEVPFYLSGNECVSFNYKNEKDPFVKNNMPLVPAEESTLTANIKAALEPSRKLNITIERTTEEKNAVKYNTIGSVLAFTPYFETDFRNYGAESMWEGLDEKTSEKRAEQLAKTKKEWKEKDKPDYMKSLAEDDLGYEVASYDNFQLLNDGRNFKKQALQYAEKFTLSNVSSFAGDDIVIGLPSLIGSQTRIEKEEQQSRAYSIYLRYPRRLSWHIEMPVPAGYKAAGLEALNKNISNNCGDFISNAKVENNLLTIDVKKMYKGAQFPAGNWQQLMDMLNAAYDFSQAKVVLIKQ